MQQHLFHHVWDNIVPFPFLFLRKPNSIPFQHHCRVAHHIFEDIQTSPSQSDEQPDCNHSRSHPHQPALLQTELNHPRQMDREQLELLPRLFYILFQLFNPFKRDIIIMCPFARGFYIFKSEQFFELLRIKIRREQGTENRCPCSDEGFSGPPVMHLECWGSAFFLFLPLRIFHQLVKKFQ